MTAIAEYTATEAALATLRETYAGRTYDVTTTKGMQEAIAGRAELRKLRIALEAKRVELKAPALERTRLIDAEAKRITAELVALEDPIDEQIKAEQQRKEREKAAAEEAERQRVAAINARVDAVRALSSGLLGKPIEFIDARIAEAKAVDVDSFPEDVRAGVRFHQTTVLGELSSAREHRIREAEEAARIAAERAELEALREAKRKADAEEAERRRQAQVERDRADRKAADERAEADRQARAERDRLAAEAKAKADEEARIIREAAEAEAKAKREAAAAEAAKRQAELDAERARLEAEHAEQLRVQREREAAEREQAIAAATLETAAREALELLHDLAPEHIVTAKLSAALLREAPTKSQAKRIGAKKSA